MKLQVTVDDALGQELQNRAHELGLSLSAYARYILIKSLATQPHSIAGLEDLKSEVLKLVV